MTAPRRWLGPALWRPRAFDPHIEPDRSMTRAMATWGCSRCFSPVEADRHDLLHAGALVAARAEGVLAAGHDQAAAKVAHVGLQGLHLRHAHELRRHVGDKHQVVAFQLFGGAAACRAGCAPRRRCSRARAPSASTGRSLGLLSALPSTYRTRGRPLTGAVMTEVLLATSGRRGPHRSCAACRWWSRRAWPGS